MLRKFMFPSNTRKTGTLHEYLRAFLIISFRILLRMRYVSGKSCRENQNTHTVFNTFSENRVVYEITCKNMIEPDREQMTI